MAGQSSAMFGWSWTDMIVLDSQVFGQALDSCDLFLCVLGKEYSKNKTVPTGRAWVTNYW